MFLYIQESFRLFVYPPDKPEIYIELKAIHKSNVSRLLSERSIFSSIEKKKFNFPTNHPVLPLSVHPPSMPLKTFRMFRYFDKKSKFGILSINIWTNNDKCLKLQSRVSLHLFLCVSVITIFYARNGRHLKLHLSRVFWPLVSLSASSYVWHGFSTLKLFSTIPSININDKTYGD